MTYYKISNSSYANSGKVKKLTPLLRGDNIINGRELFIQKKIHFTNYIDIDNAPVFDFFTMVDGGNFKKIDDWILLDCYGFIGYKVPVSGWCVSPKFKEVLERFELVQPTKFYPCKVMYKGKKLDFFIFHCAVDFYEQVEYSSSMAFLVEHKNPGIIEKLNLPANKEEFQNLELECLKNEKVIKFSKYYFQTYFDLLPYSNYAISERLKNAIEEAEITGVEITPIDDIEFEFESGIPSELEQQ